VHEQATQVVGGVGRGGLGGGLGEPVHGGHDLLVLRTVQRTDVVHAGDPAVVPLLDRPHPSGSHHAQQAGVDQKVHVVRDGALGAVDRPRHLGDGGGPLEEQLQQGRSQPVGHRSKLLGRGDHEQLFEVVVRDPLIDRHIWTVLGFWTIR
jgi:hypothetical protein